MNFKSLPTDNLYKFVTIFCIALLFTSAYSLVNVYNSYSKESQKIDIALMELQAKVKPNKMDESKLNPYKKQIDLIESNKSFLMGACVWGIIIALIGAFWGFVAWRKNLQVHLDQQVVYETMLLRNEVEAANKFINKEKSVTSQFRE